MGKPAYSLPTLHIIVQNAVPRMPNAPQPQRWAATRARQRVVPQRGLHPLPIAPRARHPQTVENLLHHSLHRCHHLLPHLGQDAGGLQALVADQRKSLGQDVL